MNSQRMESDHQAHEDFIYALYSLLQAARLHANNNEMVLNRFENFLKCIAQLTEEDDSLTIKVSSGHIIIQDEKLIYKKRTKNILENITHYFEQRNLEGLIFYESIKEALLDNVLSFIRTLNAVDQENSSLVSLTAELKNKKTAWVKIVEKPEQAVDERLSFEEEEDRKERARKDYSHVLASFKEVAGKLMSEKRSGMRKTLRAVQTMVSNVLEDDKAYTAISSLRVFDDYTYTHSVNVAILSMCIGKHLGLSRRVLERLGLCGLLHDLGKVEVPKEILTKPDKLNDLELKFIQDHPLNSAKLITKLKMSSDRKARILLPPFEHHMKYDLTGYPYAKWQKPLSLFGRILSIADVYDAITSPRVYRGSTLSPDRALGYILEGAGKIHDPILVKIFINILGVYPVGTLLRLSTGELALVVKTPLLKDVRRPSAGLMLSDNKGGYKMGKVIDLADCDPRTGEFLRDITETYHPSIFGIQPVEHIFASN